MNACSLLMVAATLLLFPFSHIECPKAVLWGALL